MNAQTILKRKTAGYNPLFLDGKQINNIFLYKDGEIIGNFKWLVRCGSNNDFPEILIPFEIKKKRKKDLSVKTGFSMSESGEWEKEFNVYLNADNFNVSDVKIVEQSGRDYNTFRSVFNIDFVCKEETTVKDETKWSGYGHVISEFKTVSHKISTFIRNEETKHKKKIDKFIEINNLGDINHTDVMRVLECAKCANVLDKY